MPSSYESLRRKFMTDTDDGIQRCEQILLDAGYVRATRDGRVMHGVFKAPAQVNLEKHTHGDIYDAIDYLCNELDYAIVRDYAIV